MARKILPAVRLPDKHSATSKPQQKPAWWSNALVRSIEDESNQMIRSQTAVVIRDKFPKSKQHFLVLPWADINDIYDVSAHIQM